ncbi:VOC family protein [Phyllobacterium sp. YR531]|uniref:VOC family protein n=1 Tax=Phyllobacterium sp. YR531 TaxID=1144343 RepID=UPI00026F7564|nr:VOC family protein [Phyllobacterium sp. YR531]EJN04585.1 lactoylglutathione lyase-like lyase [Phyllobacterium sp. YR531]
MIGYTMVGTRDLLQAGEFYDPLMAGIGFERCYSDDVVISWGSKADESVARFFVGLPFDGKAASVGNGNMTAFRVDDAETIDRLHALSVQNGGSSEGKPGLRPQYGPGFYAAYIRDPDGNKIAFVCYDA